MGKGSKLVSVWQGRTLTAYLKLKKKKSLSYTKIWTKVRKCLKLIFISSDFGQLQTSLKKSNVVLKRRVPTTKVQKAAWREGGRESDPVQSPIYSAEQERGS